MIGAPDSDVVSGSLRSAREHDLAHEMLDAAEIHRRFPPFTPRQGTVAFYEKEAGALFPEEAIRAHLDVAVDNGAHLHFDEPVTDWRITSSETVEVTTTQSKDHEAGRLILGARLVGVSALEAGLAAARSRAASAVPGSILGAGRRRMPRTASRSTSGTSVTGCSSMAFRRRRMAASKWHSSGPGTVTSPRCVPRWRRPAVARVRSARRDRLLQVHAHARSSFRDRPPSGSRAGGHCLAVLGWRQVCERDWRDSRGPGDRGEHPPPDRVVRSTTIAVKAMMRHAPIIGVPRFVGVDGGLRAEAGAGRHWARPAARRGNRDARRSRSVRWVRGAAEYHAALYQAYRLATARVEQAAAARPQGSWAVVLDADETVIDNSTISSKRARLGLGFTAPSWNAWVKRREATPLPGAAAFLSRVKALGGRIAIVTNRLQSECEDTQAVFTAHALVSTTLCRVDGTPSDKYPASKRWPPAGRPPAACRPRLSRSSATTFSTSHGSRNRSRRRARRRSASSASGISWSRTPCMGAGSNVSRDRCTAVDWLSSGGYDMKLIGVAVTIVLALPAFAVAQHEQHAAQGEMLGTVNFETSCRPDTRGDSIAPSRCCTRSVLGGASSVQQVLAAIPPARWRTGASR